MLGFKKSPEDFGYYGAFIEKADVRKEIHVGNLTYNDGSLVEKYLILVSGMYNILCIHTLFIYNTLFI